MDKLKPCPFCESNCVNDTTPPTGGEDGVFYWTCPDCIASGPIGHTVEGATDGWNSRADFSTVDGKQLVSEEAIKWLFDNHPGIYNEFYSRV